MAKPHEDRGTMPGTKVPPRTPKVRFLISGVMGLREGSGLAALRDEGHFQPTLHTALGQEQRPAEECDRHQRQQVKRMSTCNCMHPCQPLGSASAKARLPCHQPSGHQAGAGEQGSAVALQSLLKPDFQPGNCHRIFSTTPRFLTSSMEKVTVHPRLSIDSSWAANNCSRRKSA